jgi:hypothetical protein
MPLPAGSRVGCLQCAISRWSCTSRSSIRAGSYRSISNGRANRGGSIVRSASPVRLTSSRWSHSRTSSVNSDGFVPSGPLDCGGAASLRSPNWSHRPRPDVSVGCGSTAKRRQSGDGAFHGKDSHRAVAVVQRPRQRSSWPYGVLDAASRGLGSAAISNRNSRGNGFSVRTRVSISGRDPSTIRFSGDTGDSTAIGFSGETAYRSLTGISTVTTVPLPLSSVAEYVRV